MSISPLPFGVSEFTTWHQTFEEDLALYQRWDVASIEVCERKLSRHPEQARQQLGLLDEVGLRVSSVQPRVHALFPDTLAPDPLEPDARAEAYRQTIDLFSEALPGRELTFVTIGGAAPHYDFRQAWNLAVTHYRRLAEYAAARGARIAFEPLHPILMNVDTFICTLAGARRLCEEVDHPAFGIMIDTWHLWQEPGVAERIVQTGSWIFGVQVSDYPASGPRALADRLVPGDGVSHLPDLIAATARAGYTGSYCLEIFSDDGLPDSLWLADPNVVLERSMGWFRGVWESLSAGSTLAG